jgi:capsular polysaccharide biosynthesis protein
MTEQSHAGNRAPREWEAGRGGDESLTRELAVVLRAHWAIVLVAALATAAGAWLLTSMQTRRYRVAAIAVVAPMTDSMSGDERIRAIQALDQRVIIATAAALASTPSVQAQALPQAPAPNDSYAIRALPLPDTNLLRIEVEGRDVAHAAEIANRMPAILNVRTQAIFRFFGVTAVSPAAEGELIAPRVGRIVAVGFLIGAMLGIGIAWALVKMRPAAGSAR